MSYYYLNCIKITIENKNNRAYDQAAKWVCAAVRTEWVPGLSTGSGLANVGEGSVLTGLGANAGRLLLGKTGGEFIDSGVDVFRFDFFDFWPLDDRLAFRFRVGDSE